MNPQLLKKIIEGALLASEKPLSIERLLNLFGEDEAVSQEMIQDALSLIEQDHEGRGIELKEVSSGFRMQVKKECAAWISRLWDERPQRYSRALLETLVLIAYRQPVTRAEIENVRGVAVSSNIIKTLQEREWIRVLGHREVPGRPALYGTTRQFLDYFNLKSLEGLPSLKEIADFDDINFPLDLEGGTVEETQERQIMPSAKAQIKANEKDVEVDSAVEETPSEVSLDSIEQTVANG
ncbi:Segregation and condensation protein B [hydrothermal vent metagenome]|uniref:Segregation and condensation protein B n=1 Tax=hydrothermal vent metagenome TaxID=652676 RepID=A0A3B0ZI26_9ZZZZ